MLDLDNIQFLEENWDYGDFNSLSHMYVHPVRKNNKRYVELKALDPDWELEKIITGFLPRIDFAVFLALFFSVVAILYAILESIIYDSWADFFAIMVVFGTIPILYLFIRGKHYISGIVSYYMVLDCIKSNLTKQIIKLSTAETKIFSKGTATNDEIDAKLDLASARESLRYLKEYSRLPYIGTIKTLVKIVPIVSVISFTIGPLLQI